MMRQKYEDYLDDLDALLPRSYICDECDIEYDSVDDPEFPVCKVCGILMIKIYDPADISD
jgi:hypothetical protein